MKCFLITGLLFFALGNCLKGQNCDSLLGYAKDDKYSIYLVKALVGKVQGNPTDNMHGLICKVNYFKTPNSTGINFVLFFVRCGKMMDASVKVKVEFMDGSNIFLKRSIYDKDNETGMFNFIAGGDYGNNYELTMLRTKSISKISISGNEIDSYTYVIDYNDSLTFMWGLGCLYNLTK